MDEKIIYFDRLDDVNARMSLHGGDGMDFRRIEGFVYNTLSFHDKSKTFTWAAQNGYDDCMVRFYDKGTHSLPIGLIPRITRTLKEMYSGWKVRISDSIRAMYTPPAPISQDAIRAYAVTLDLHGTGEKGERIDIVPYEHQYRLVEQALNRRRCSLLACTSAGKSLSMCIIARYLVEKERRKILIIVPSTNLVEQLYSDFHDDYGWAEARQHCTLLHGTSEDKLTKRDMEHLEALNLGEESVLKDITIATWQTLTRKSDEFFRVFTAVLVDEAHSARGVELRDIIAKCVNALDFKVGVSGTLPDDGLDAGQIEGALGPKVEVVRLKELVRIGILTPVEVDAIYIPYPPANRRMLCKQPYKSQASIMMRNGSRNDVIDMLIDSGHIGRDQNTVILYKTKQYLEELHSHLSTKYPDFNYHVIRGEVSPEEREAIRKAMGKSRGNIILGTYGCMKQGVNIRLLHNLVFAEPAKSEYMVVQSIGRIVRPHPEKKLAKVFDLVDDASYFINKRSGGQTLRVNYMVAHYNERLDYYNRDGIPVHEIHLDGQYEATIDTEDIDSMRKKAAEGGKSKKPKPEYTYKKKFFE